MNSELNYEHVFEVLVDRTSKYLLEHNLKAMVLGISGGIDSTVVAAICYEVSKRTGIPLIGRSLPIKNKQDEFDVSRLVGEAFCNNFKVVYLEDSYNQILTDIVCLEEGYTEFGGSVESMIQTPIANGNIQARLRMVYLYNLASVNNGIVMSTDNQTEYQLGFWTLHGDVGDFNPLFGLWKTEVYKLAKWIETMYGTMAEGADDAITMEKYLRKEFAIHKSIALTPTDGLGISSSDLEQIGASSYAEVDDILQTMLLYKNPESEKWDLLYDKYGEEVTDKVWNRHLASEFKRKNLPITIQRHEYSTDDD
jgi:NAD+ synthetase